MIDTDKIRDSIGIVVLSTPKDDALVQAFIRSVIEECDVYDRNRHSCCTHIHLMCPVCIANYHNLCFAEQIIHEYLQSIVPNN